MMPQAACQSNGVALLKSRALTWNLMGKVCDLVASLDELRLPPQ
jgi:hypothetical protein